MDNDLNQSVPAEEPPSAVLMGAICGALLEAVKEKGLEDIRELLRCGAEVNGKGDKFGNTPLMFAAFSGREDIVRLLIDNGARVNETNNMGSCALRWAVEAGRMQMARLLTDNGATLPSDSKMFISHPELREWMKDAEIRLQKKAVEESQTYRNLVSVRAHVLKKPKFRPAP